MLHLKNFTEYANDEYPGIIFFKTEDGKDFYKNRDRFQENTYKLVFRPETGEICQCEQDISVIRPLIGADVIELESVPADLNLDTLSYYLFDGKNIIENTKLKEEIQRQNNKVLIQELSFQIEALKDKIDFGFSTDIEKDNETLLSLRKQRASIM